MKWEYLLTDESFKDHKEIDKWLLKIGSDGWETVSFEHSCYTYNMSVKALLKRRKRSWISRKLGDFIKIKN